MPYPCSAACLSCHYGHDYVCGRCILLTLLFRPGRGPAGKPQLAHQHPPALAVVIATILFCLRCILLSFLSRPGRGPAGKPHLAHQEQPRVQAAHHHRVEPGCAATHGAAALPHDGAGEPAVARAVVVAAAQWSPLSVCVFCFVVNCRTVQSVNACTVVVLATA